MKSTIKILLVLSLFSLVFASCSKEEDEEDELHIEFKTEAGFISSDTTLVAGSIVKIGIEAETEKPQDPIINFNVTEEVNGGPGMTVGGEDSLSATTYNYDFMDTLGTTSGESHKYTFTIVNRDGIDKQASLSITIQ